MTRFSCSVLSTSAILLLIGCTGQEPAAEAEAVAALVVVEKKANQVGFYASDGTRLAGVSVGETPHEMVLDADGRHLYVSDNGVLWMDYDGPGGNTVSIVDLETRSKVGEISLGDYHRPHGLSIDPSGKRLLVTSENPNSLVLIDLKTRSVVKAYDNGGDAPHMVMFDKAGEWAYASNTNSNNVAAVNLETGAIVSITGCGGPQGGVLTDDGTRYYVTCRDTGTIQVIDTASKSAVGEIKTGLGVNRINLTPDEGTLVYSIGGEGKFVAFADVASLEETGRVELGGPPLSCTLSRNGDYAFAGVQDSDEIYVISVADRKIVQVIKTPEGQGPDPVMDLGSYSPPA
ncbi:MAG: YncE family protein [Acidobacteria bacterium]|nr:YncE family protein [Acidobacteriota bacterium]MDA1235296.1 YncE family protein [Acidobacteriota bacterium]